MLESLPYLFPFIYDSFSSKIHILATLIWKDVVILFTYFDLFCDNKIFDSYHTHFWSFHQSFLFNAVSRCTTPLHCSNMLQYNSPVLQYQDKKEVAVSFTVTQRVAPPVFPLYNPTWTSLKLIQGHCYFWQSQKQKSINGTHWAKLLAL